MSSWRTRSAIPFAAFAVSEPHDVEVMADEIDGTVVRVQAPRGGLHPTAGPAVAAPGRAVVAVAGVGWHTLDELVDGFLGRFAQTSVGLVHELPSTQVHHDPADLGHWTAVDRSRGRVASALDVVVCSHGLVQPGATFVVSIDAPAHMLGALVTAASELSAAQRRALLTSAGSVTCEAA